MLSFPPYPYNFISASGQSASFAASHLPKSLTTNHTSLKNPAPNTPDHIVKMVAFRAQVLVLAALGLGVLATPIETNTSAITCANVRCPQRCEMIGGKPVCVPTIPDTPVTAREAVQCGPTVCTNGQQCCNESCGICTAPGGFCTQEFCAPAAKKCGKTECAAGLECCNASCGVCVSPGGSCTQQICPSPQ